MNVAALIAIAVKLDAPGFATRFPDPMLVVRKRSDPSDPTLQTELDMTQTKPSGMKTGGFNTSRNAPGERRSASITGGLADASVEPITKSRRNPFEGMITIGRAVNNDVCLHVSSVSKLHAYFRKESGKWVLRDKHSSNGTFVNGTRLKPEEPIVVQDGAYLLFGPDADCLFKLPLSLHAFLVEVSKLGR